MSQDRSKGSEFLSNLPPDGFEYRTKSRKKHLRLLWHCVGVKFGRYLNDEFAIEPNLDSEDKAVRDFILMVRKIVDAQVVALREFGVFW